MQRPKDCFHAAIAWQAAGPRFASRPSHHMTDVADAGFGGDSIASAVPSTRCDGLPRWNFSTQGGLYQTPSFTYS